MNLSVVCYSGHKVDQRPVRFRLDSADYFVEEIMAQWRGPVAEYFQVRVTDGGVYTLRRSSAALEGEGGVEAS